MQMQAQDKPATAKSAGAPYQTYHAQDGLHPEEAIYITRKTPPFIEVIYLR